MSRCDLFNPPSPAGQSRRALLVEHRIGVALHDVAAGSRAALNPLGGIA
jgi:hypothetical protein